MLRITPHSWLVIGALLVLPLVVGLSGVLHAGSDHAEDCLLCSRTPERPVALLPEAVLLLPPQPTLANTPIAAPRLPTAESLTSILLRGPPLC